MRSVKLLSHLVGAAYLVLHSLTGCAAPSTPSVRETPTALPSPTPLPTPTIPTSLTKQGVSFETLAQGDSLIAGLRQPAVFVAQKRDEVEQLASRVHEPEVAERVRAVELDKHLLLAVFLETKSSTGYRVRIQEVAVSQAEIKLTVELSEPAPGQAVADVLASPYHFILLPTGGISLDQEFAVKVFTTAGTLIAQTKYP